MLFFTFERKRKLFFSLRVPTQNKPLYYVILCHITSCNSVDKGVGVDTQSSSFKPFLLIASYIPTSMFFAAFLSYVFVCESIPTNNFPAADHRASTNKLPQTLSLHSINNINGYSDRAFISSLRIGFINASLHGLR